METLNRISIRADIDDVYRAAEAIVHWPEILPHYRWVTIFEEGENWRHVEMAAWRDGFPCRWQSEQRLYPKEKKVYYRHTRSFWTQDMVVWWHLEPGQAGNVEIRLTHEMKGSSFAPFQFFQQHVVGEFFVAAVAEKTLRGLKRYLESK